MVERLFGAPAGAWWGENWPVIPVAALVVALVWVTWWEFVRIDEVERDRDEDFDDGERLA